MKSGIGMLKDGDGHIHDVAFRADRLFVAIELPAGVRAMLTDLKAEMPGLNAKPPQNLHLTLRFIGHVPREKTVSIRRALEQVKAAPFSLSLVRLGMFQHNRRTVLWIGPEKSRSLDELKRCIDLMLQRRAGLAALQESFIPHITLARITGTPSAQLRDFIRAGLTVPPPVLPVGHFTLFGSTLSPGGAVHRALQCYRLS